MATKNRKETGICCADGSPAGTHGTWIVESVVFGEIAHDKGIDLDREVLRVEVPADRIWKEVFYIPALLLLAFIRVLQKGRARKHEEMA